MSNSRSYLDFARVGRGRWYVYLVGTLLILGAWMVLGGIISVIPDLMRPAPPAWVVLVFTLLAFVGLFVGVPLVVRVVNGRPWKTVITPYTRINWAMVGKGVAFWLIPMAVFQLLAALLDSDGLRVTTDINGWLLSVVVVLLLLFIQTTGEELLFRGYLIQWASLATRRAWVLALISGVLFGLPHWANPEVTSQLGLGAIVTASTYVVVGFVWGWVSVKSGTIELAVGAHFVNNLAAILVIAPEDAALQSALIVDGSINAYLNSAVAILTALAFMFLCRGQVGSGEPIEVAAEVAEAVDVTPEGIPAGWYADPVDDTQVRWWDGSAWTDHMQDKPDQ